MPTPARWRRWIAPDERPPQLRAISTERRDLFDRPLVPDEIDRFDALVIDPAPRRRRGADARFGTVQDRPYRVRVLRRGDLRARHGDPRGRRLVVETVEPVDQFRHSAHVEIVGLFRRDRRGRSAVCWIAYMRWRTPDRVPSQRFLGDPMSVATAIRPDADSDALLAALRGIVGDCPRARSAGRHGRLPERAP